MKGMTDKPLAFLDVDGVLNVRRMPYREYQVEVATASLSVSPFTNSFAGDVVTFTVRIPTEIPGWLGELGESFELAWATTWEHAANDYLSGLLGVGQLAVVELSATEASWREVRNGDIGAWKWRAITQYAGQRPFVFIDDDNESVARAHHDGAQRALWAPEGMTRAHVEEMLTFARDLASGAAVAGDPDLG